MKYHILFLVMLARPASADEAQFGFRALWAPPSDFATSEAADRLIDECTRAKINVIFPCVMQHGGLQHKSSHYRHKSVEEGDFDPLAYLAAKAHATGIQVHAWYCVYYEGVKPLIPADPDWLCSDIDGKRMSDTFFLSPQVPAVNDYLLSVMKDGLAYDIDGIHLDYIRYHGTGYDYSDPGRKDFVAAHGFDPIDFLDHADRIVSLDQDPFPVRVLHADRQKTRPWEVSWTESLLDRAGIGFGFVSETTARIDSLPAPGALILSCYYDVPADMEASIERYVNRGGSVLCINPAFREGDTTLATLFGVQAGTTNLPEAWRTLKTNQAHPLASHIPGERFLATGFRPSGLDGGIVVAEFDSGGPAVVANASGSGRTVVIAFNAGRVATEAMAGMVNGIIRWFRSESGVKTDDSPLEAKRAEWIQWRNDAITSLVRDVHEMVKAKSPKLRVSIAGGCNDLERYLIFRDGRRWMEEGLLDFACPMDYGDDLESLQQMLDTHRNSTPQKMMGAVYPGLALYTNEVVDGKKTTRPQDPEILREQIELLRKNGYRGFALFSSMQLTEDHIEVIAEK